MNSDLRSWPILNTLKPDFVSQIHMVFVYGKLANEALIVTKDKMVYGLGNNINGRLGIEDKNAALEPKKIEPLCEQDIKTFAYSFGSHILALTKEGNVLCRTISDTVHSWDDNEYGQSESFSETYKGVPFKVIVMEIACSNYYSFALTKDGEIYTWGNNAYLQSDSSNYSDYDVRRSEEICQPVLLPFEKKVVHISCGSTFTIAIIENGEVYSCGNNHYGQLGRNYNRQEDGQLERVDLLCDTIAVKVVCGSDHTLALTDKREIYAWGRNDNGQLGIRNNEKLFKPVLVKHELERMKWIDIAALNCSDISIAVDEDERIYVWGGCRSESIFIPIATSFSNMHDAIAYYGPGVMHKPLILCVNEGPDLLECLKSAFDDPSTSDLKIQVEDQYIHVHKTILKIRCLYFRTMFQHDWAENNQSVIKHNQFSYITYKAFLKYLYTDIVDLPVEKASELLDLAESYCESNLKELCIRMIKQEITMSNIEYVYSIAVKYSLEELEEFCVKFAINHTKAATQTDDFGKLIQKMMKTFIMKASEVDDFKK